MASLEKKEEKEKEIDEEENDHDYDEMANVEMIILLRHYDSHYDYLDPTEFGIGNTPIWDSFDFPYFPLVLSFFSLSLSPSPSPSLSSSSLFYSPSFASLFS